MSHIYYDKYKKAKLLYIKNNTQNGGLPLDDSFIKPYIIDSSYLFDLLDEMCETPYLDVYSKDSDMTFLTKLWKWFMSVKEFLEQEKMMYDKNTQVLSKINSIIQKIEKLYS